MADVLANDLERLVPADKERIQGNLAKLKRQLLELTANSQVQLAKVDNLSVVSLSERLGYLASGEPGCGGTAAASGWQMG